MIKTNRNLKSSKEEWVTELMIRVKGGSINTIYSYQGRTNEPNDRELSSLVNKGNLVPENWSQHRSDSKQVLRLSDFSNSVHSASFKQMFYFTEKVCSSFLNLDKQ